MSPEPDIRPDFIYSDEGKLLNEIVGLVQGDYFAKLLSDIGEQQSDRNSAWLEAGQIYPDFADKLLAIHARFDKGLKILDGYPPTTLVVLNRRFTSLTKDDEVRDKLAIFLVGKIGSGISNSKNTLEETRNMVNVLKATLPADTEANLTFEQLAKQLLLGTI